MSEEDNNLGKNIATILENRYIIPLYQRNFAWNEEQIVTLLQNIYESYHKNKDSNYFIGTLTVLRRSNGDYEIIDGQQRFTVITLISKILGISREPKLFYDSRPEVEEFFKEFYRDGDCSKIEKVYRLKEAVDYIYNTNLTAKEDDKLILKERLNDLKDFVEYFRTNVIWIVAEIPEDTDVAAYFEIMNNRGEQLQKHELLKSRMMEKIKGENEDKNKAIFAKIWDACSIMDLPIQECFSQRGATDDYIGDRVVLFGDNFDKLCLDNISVLATLNINEKAVSIEEIVKGPSIGDEFQAPSALDANGKKRIYYSIIDFPNFLMHVLKIVYDENIALNDKELLNAFVSIQYKFDAMTFIKELLKLRFLFDRYIIRAGYSEESGDDIDRWYLVRPQKGDQNKLYFVNTFGQSDGDDQTDVSNDDIIKPLSMLQVTFRQRIYKDWLYNSLKWLNSQNDINSTDYIQFLNEYITNYYKGIADTCSINDLEWNKIPHFVFNYIDYLYWINNKNKFNFDFKYRNSIEHHYPQSFNSLNGTENYIGNLCLVSKSANSSMNSKSPDIKARKYYKDTLPPKQKRMYDITNSKNTWGEEEIRDHNQEVNKLLRLGFLILK
ncbi:MAG: DUF262 domain-containing protein [Rikenellaceae bacterium]